MVGPRRYATVFGPLNPFPVPLGRSAGIGLFFVPCLELPGVGRSPRSPDIGREGPRCEYWRPHYSPAGSSPLVVRHRAVGSFCPDEHLVDHLIDRSWGPVGPTHLGDIGPTPGLGQVQIGAIGFIRVSDADGHTNLLDNPLVCRVQCCDTDGDYGHNAGG